MKELATTRKYSSPRLKNSQSTALERRREVGGVSERLKWQKSSLQTRMFS